MSKELLEYYDKIQMVVPLMDIVRVQNSLKDIEDACQLWGIPKYLQETITKNIRKLHYNNYKTVGGFTIKELEENGNE